jgi:aryl-alcohol dehydrogenase-like predicted oxidoreductase
MIERKLWNGRTIPALGLGCWAIGGPFYAGTRPLGWGEVDDRESLAAIARGVELGIRFFDTACSYGGGHSEEVLGLALSKHPDVLIATKFGNTFDAEKKQATGPDATPAGIERSVEGSLRRLRRERIDLLQLHLNSLPIAEAGIVFDTLDRLRHAGKIDAYGWSTDFPDRAEAFAGREGFVSVQHAMNVFVPASQVLAVIERHNLLSINRGPLAMGLLTGKFAAGSAISPNDVRSNTLPWLAYFKEGKVVPDFARRLDAVRDLLTTGGRTLSQGALGWLWARSSKTLPIPGFRTVKQVEENAGALRKGPLPQEVMAEIERVILREPEGAPRER